MPLPTPRDGESQSVFVARCMRDSVMVEEYPNNDQRVTICNTQWQERSMDPNDKLLAIVRKRAKQAEFGYGITTADRYVDTVRRCVGSDLCYRYAATKSTSFQDVLDKASKTLVYSSPDMEVESNSGPSEGWAREWLKQVNSDVEIPKNTLIAFRHILTTPRKDRDGDILRTDGATVDPKLLLLWQHVHTLPIGKMLAVAEHTAQKLSLISAVVDMNDLCHDAAVMIDSGMGRFSHGFRALEFEDLKEEEGETTSPGGFDIKKFEIMEASLVSVPSNVDAETEEVLLGLVEGGKLISPLMKATGEQIRANRPLTLNIPTSTELVNKLVGDYLERTLNKLDKDLGDGQDDDKTTGSQLPTSGDKDCACSSKETDDKAKDEGTKEGGETCHPEVAQKRLMLSGSWEWIEKILRQKAQAFLAAHGVDMRDRFVWVAGTFADHGIICSESNFSDVPDEFLYWRADWTMDGEDPGWTGSPEAVRIETTVEIRERSPLFDQKAGRQLSARNLQTLRDVKADLEELMEKEDMSRGGGALCARCIGKLHEIIEAAAGPDEETSSEITVKEAIAVVVAQASSEERQTLGRILTSLEDIEQQHRLADQLLALSAG